MAKIVLVHGAFNELWGPNELKSRWLPAVRDGLWHHGLEIDDDDVQVCFYGDLFRRAPGTAEDEQFEQSRAGIAESLHEMGGDTVAMLGQAANDAAFDRTVDMVTIMATDPDLRAKMRARIEPLVDDETRVVGRALARHRAVVHGAREPSAVERAHVRDARFAAGVPDDRRHARSAAGRRQGSVAGLDRAVGERARRRRQSRRGAGRPSASASGSKT